MEVTGKIKSIKENETVGTSNFRKRSLILTTDEQYPQVLDIQFVQDKCDLLDNYKLEQDVKVQINLRGREWINPQGESICFNTIQGWRIEELEAGITSAKITSPPTGIVDDLPF
jgi:hypothetical protein